MHLNKILEQIKRHQFMFNPYFGRRTNFRLLDQVIPKVTTISVSDTDTATTLGICPKVWCQLPREGVMVFEARHTPAEASAELPVLISPTGSVSPAANTKNIPVVKADSSPLTGSEIAAGNRYFILSVNVGYQNTRTRDNRYF